MRQNKAIYMTFPVGASSATANISIPFTVKTIHVKSSAYITSAPPPAGDALYIYVLSDLTQNSPLCMVYRDSTYPYSTAADVEFEFQNPQVINGLYNFSLMDLTGAPIGATVGGDSLGLILEFNGEYSANGGERRGNL